MDYFYVIGFVSLIGGIVLQSIRSAKVDKKSRINLTLTGLPLGLVLVGLVLMTISIFV